ncbi:MAG TPA: CBS domain-containing protein [Gaiellaceae bacterium]|nr:CBS domain-containing protein [Gaiellaceae bacterium]
MSKAVAEVMTADPYTISPQTAASEAARIMLERDVGSVPVVEDGHLLGIVTDRDLALRVVAAGRDPNTTKVEEIATADLHSAGPDDSLDEAFDRMSIWRIRRLPVVESDRLVGMLAQADVVHALKDKKAGRLVEEISRPGKPAFRMQEVGIS